MGFEILKLVKVLLIIILDEEQQDSKPVEMVQRENHKGMDVAYVIITTSLAKITLSVPLKSRFFRKPNAP